MNEIKDMLGNELSLGDNIATAVMAGYSTKRAEMRISTIVEVVNRLDGPPVYRVQTDYPNGRIKILTPKMLKKTILIDR